MTPEHVTALVLALGGATIIPKIIEGWRASKSGEARAEKARHRMFLNEAEETTSYLRVMQEHAAELRRILIDWGFPKEQLPPWPVRKRSAKP